jgi:HSP20 family protein
MGDLMVEKEIKEKKEQAEEKAAEVKKATLEKKEETEEKAVEVKKATLEKKEETEKAAMSSENQAERMINEFLSNIRSRQEDFSKALADYTTAMQKPLADVVETDDEIIVKTDLPGVKKDDINVTLTEDSVEITAQFNEEFSEQDVDYIKRERNYGKTHKMMKLPAKVKVKDATAKFENSILTINLPKLEKSKFKIDVT